ncbi:PrsW family intramembrane metalloprotease [Oceanitalea stevensii]|uniref:PrsW family intramembrane metalloprotease n=1 Tax=Oceanitalea stevensii TaxID=2763072 RepID=A0ABR8YYR9_9MICO|nr:PrsW family intramembrane metalloprotease [Oceanitalea stevensii]MBD8061227.1 PrsW family intramembrane metalloprotease [Oceanitalea stevensii]
MALPPQPYPPSGRPAQPTAYLAGQQPQTAPWGTGGPPAPAQAPWQPPRPRRGGTVFVLVGTGVGILALIATVAQIASLTSAGAALTGGIVALVPLAAVLLGIRWIDRWEPEPRYALLFAFLWGAGVSTLVSIWLNTAFSTAVYYSTGNVETAEVLGAALGAPLIEETAKGMGVLILFLARRRYFDGPVDGIVYAATVAAGFAFVENILYFGRSIDMLPQIFIMRGILSPFAHVMFTVAIGIALGLAARSRSSFAWVGALPLGWLVAVLLHALWNGSTFTGSFFGLYVLVQVPLFVAGIILVVWLRRRERRVITGRLVEYARAGWLAPHEVTMLGSFPGRRAAMSWAARGGPSAKAAMRTFQHSATALALGRQRFATGRAEPSYHHDERVLLDRVTTSRTTFLQALTQVR